MPRKNRRPSGRRRTWHYEPKPKRLPPTPDQLAADLVRRGLASDQILDRYIPRHIPIGDPR